MDELKQFDTSFSYQKILASSSRTDTVPATGSPPSLTVTIPHNLSLIPNVRVWYEVNGRKFPASFEQYSDDVTFVSENDLVTVQSVHVTTTDLVVNYYNASGVDKTVITHYRLYYNG